MRKKMFIVGAMVFAILASPTFAHWDPGDGHKMHYPQLPDPAGWDVYAEAPLVLADDWLCTGSGPVSDVHFWGSWMNDVVGNVLSIHLSIHSDDRSGQFSKPGELLWQRDFGVGEFTMRTYASAPQGWYNPLTGGYILDDHEVTWQYNVENIPDPFVQREGEIYWLDISMNYFGCEWGWKTSLDHFEDDAVWGELPDAQWQELLDPLTGESLDMAFVITPEPERYCCSVSVGWLCCENVKANLELSCIDS